MGRTETLETRAFIRLVLGTLTVLGLLTGANVLLILNAVGSDIFTPIQRNIAAVTSEAEVGPRKVSSPVIEINCNKELGTLRVRTQAASVRVIFRNCENIGRILNKSNKNQGDVFPLKGATSTSDFVFLSEGLNSIEVPLGDETQVIEITREVVKTAEPDKAL